MRNNRRKLLLILLITILSVVSCASPSASVPSRPGQKLKVCTTLFPVYDFARTVGGNRADVVLLLPPGTESHSYEPSAADMIKIYESDLFIYTGPYMEAWANDLTENLSGSRVTIVDSSENIVLASEEETENEDYAYSDVLEIAHVHAYDPHIWTSPLKSIQMVQNICNAFCETDPENSAYYKQNAKDYLRKLTALDQDFRALSAASDRSKLYFGGRFSLFYFVSEYGFSWESAYTSCSSDSEPSVQSVSHMISEMKTSDVPVIFYEELSDPKVSQVISEETGAVPLLFHSCHNVSRDEFQDGVTYLSLMQQNLTNLKEALK